MSGTLSTEEQLENLTRLVEGLAKRTLKQEYSIAQLMNHLERTGEISQAPLKKPEVQEEVINSKKEHDIQVERLDACHQVCQRGFLSNPQVKREDHWERNESSIKMSSYHVQDVRESIRSLQLQHNSVVINLGNMERRLDQMEREYAKCGYYGNLGYEEYDEGNSYYQIGQSCWKKNEMMGRDF
ncbi:hypothetical protein M9H77_23412 [Catharanthus roseus]|uniref:Uncharacterized protein n=1 Tax=Catharanthus roseus TaxID=4058 RepID=A0ACC0AT70_CATRO|nr:hypothetical protein M9H77_23412 [Catharanthus roseus]